MYECMYVQYGAHASVMMLYFMLGAAVFKIYRIQRQKASGTVRAGFTALQLVKTHSYSIFNNFLLK